MVLSLTYLINIVSLAVILLISIWLHEYAHAYVSYIQWDPTPKLQWRLTTNPFKHIDIIWFLMIFLIWFGWWKPVQINPYYYKNPVKWELFTALAGPATNLCLSIIGIILILIIWKISGLALTDIYLGNYDFLIWFFLKFSMINIALAVFNMIPLPPLDGFRLVKIISAKFASNIERYTTYIAIWLILLIVLGERVIWLDVVWNFISTVSSSIFNAIFTLFSSIFY